MKRSVCLLICSLMILFICVTLSGCGESADTALTPYDSGDASNDSAYRRTVLYYATADGLVVPIMKKIPWEEGIGKAALSYLVSNYDNDLSASKLGVMTVIPKGTDVDLTIEDGKAKVTLEGMPKQDEANIKNMVTAIVNTLTEFSSINTVSIVSDGKILLRDTTRLVMNVEDSEVSVSSDNANRMTLYFPNAQASLNIPVTRYCNSKPTFENAVLELIEGPKEDSLLACFPKGTELNGAEISDNIAIVDLSAQFLDAANTEGLISACYDCLYLTASEYAVVYDVELRIDGNTYNFSSEPVFAPMYVNEF